MNISDLMAECASLAIEMYQKRGCFVPTLWINGGNQSAIVAVRTTVDGCDTTSPDAIFAACRHIIAKDNSEVACLALALNNGLSTEYISVVSETRSGARDVWLLASDGSVADGDFAEHLREALYASPEFSLYFQNTDKQ